MRKSRFLLDKKEEAHLLIRDLQISGLVKNEIYARLSKKLGIPQSECHFAKMNKVQQVQNGIYALEQMWHEYKHEKRKRQIKRRKERTLKKSIQVKPKHLVLVQKDMTKLTARVSEQNMIEREDRNNCHPILFKYLPFLLRFIRK